MIEATSGDAFINGYSLNHETDQVRANLSLCQQFDVLFDKLNPREHLKLVADLRGVPKSEVAGEINQILDLVMLQQKQHTLVEHLSGGMKRKLSLGMALVGKASVLLLDEPTSGLDVESRS